MTLVSPKSVDQGTAWGALKVSFPLFLGLVVGRAAFYLGYVVPFSRGTLEPTLAVFVIHSLTYLPIGVYYVLSGIRKPDRNRREPTWTCDWKGGYDHDGLLCC